MPLRLSLATGLLLGISYPSGILPQWVGGWIVLLAYTPILLAYVSARSLPPRTWHLYLGMAVFHGIANWWVGSYQSETDPYLLASGIALMLGHPLFLMLPLVATGYVRRRLSPRAALYTFPCLIGAFEFLHGQTDASYPWLSVGYSLVDTPLVQFADVVGVYGLGALIAAVNVAFIVALTDARKRLSIVGVTSLLLACWIGYGVHTTSQFTPENVSNHAALHVAMVQGNDNPWDKWSRPSAQVERTKWLSQRALDSIRRTQPVDVIVWPETAIPYPIRHAQYSDEWNVLLRWTQDHSVALLTGLSDIYVYPSGLAPASARTSTTDPSLKYDLFNAAALIAPGSVAVHYKSCLTPFAERLPFAEYLAFAQSWFQWGVGISSWGKGATRKPLPLRLSNGLHQVGTIICIESIYPDMVRDVVRNGATVLCVITNDAWYNGTPGPRQHYTIARVRAIEQRRWLFRCALSGVTGVIAPNGTSVQELPEMSVGVLAGSVFSLDNHTVYARIGDVLPIFLCVLSLITLFYAGYTGARARVQRQQFPHDNSSSPSSTL